MEWSFRIGWGRLALLPIAKPAIYLSKKPIIRLLYLRYALNSG